MDTITFVTTNDLKLRYAEAAFAPYDLAVEPSDYDTPEIQADDCATVAEQEARDAAAALDQEVLVADNGLFVDALDGFPGPYTAYNGRRLGPDRFLRLFAADDDRAATLVYVVAYAEPDGTTELFPTETPGRVAAEPRGSGTFMDTLFVPEDEDETLAEIRQADFDRYRQFWDRSTPRFADWYTGRDG